MEPLKDTYKSIERKGEGLYKMSGSRFIAFAYPIETVAEVKPILDSLKKEYYDARHHCYAYRVGSGGEFYRANDDGEPSSSAGRPILGQIDSKGLSDVLVVVIRYFGGIKLGIPGLIKAYKTSSAQALESGGLREKISGRRFSIIFGHEAMGQVMSAMKDFGVRLERRSFQMECEIDFWVRLSDEPALLSRLGDIKGCSCSPIVKEE